MTTSSLSRRGRRQEALAGYAFTLPQLLGFILFTVIPLVCVFVFSFESRKLSSRTYEWIGFENYARLFRKDMFYTTMSNTLVFSLLLVPLNLALSLGMAMYLSKKNFGTHYIRAIIFLPVVTSGVAWALVWKYLLQPGQSGVINYLLSLVGIEGPNWLHEKGWAMFSVVLSRVLKGLGTNVLLFTGAVLNMQQSLIEAGRMDGANAWKLFWHIKLPLLMPTVLMCSIVTVIGSMRVFDTIKMMTDGGPEGSTMVLVYYIYNQGFSAGKVSYASALSVILFLIVLVLTLIQWAMRRRLSHFEA